MSNSILSQLPKQAMSAEHARFKLDVAALLARHDMVWPSGPPAHWTLGAPIGNGDLGAVVYGHPDSLSFALGKMDVWEQMPWDQQDLYPEHSFATMRQTYLDNDPDAYSTLLADLAGRQKASQKQSHLTTCGTFRLRLDDGNSPHACAMRVALVEGVAQITYTNRCVRAFVSRQYDALVIEFDRGEPLHEHSAMSDCIPADRLAWEFFRAPSEATGESFISRMDERSCLLTQPLGEGASYTVGIAWACDGDSLTHSFPGQVNGNLGKVKSRKVYFYVTAASSRETDDTVALCQERLARLQAVDPADVIGSHRQWWMDYWRRGLCTVGDEAVEKLYYRSLYLCGSMLEPGKQSPGLQGAWTAELMTAWGSDFHANVNIQSVYWGMYTNNRLDCVEPFLRLYHGFADRARARARDYFGLRGLRFPHAGSIDGMEATQAPFYMLSCDVSASAWIGQLFWQYYDYTRDQVYLRDIAYPILRDIARLLADYLIDDPATGRAMIAPAVEFETTNPRFTHWGTNSLYAVTLFRVGFQQAIDAAEQLGVDPAEREEWRVSLAKLPPPPMTPDSIFKEWENHDLCNRGGHAYYLCLAFPGELVSRYHGPREWLEAARRTWQRIKTGELKSCSGGAWCGGQGVCELIRIGEIEDAFPCARLPEKATENGFSLMRDGGAIQVDHTPGMNRVLADMMLLTLGGVVHVFPGIPAAMPARFLSLRAAGGFLLTAEKRGESVDYVLIEPTVKGPIRIADPWQGRGTLYEVATGKRLVRPGPDDIIAADLEMVHRYAVLPEGVSLESIGMVPFSFGKIEP
jgi:hypothetical protein